MNRDQVKEVFKLLKNVYPQFDVTKEKVDTWHKLLNDQNPAVIMRNAERYVLEFKFPPSIADLRERKNEAYNSKVLQEIKDWESVASGKR